MNKCNRATSLEATLRRIEAATSPLTRAAYVDLARHQLGTFTRLRTPELVAQYKYRLDRLAERGAQARRTSKPPSVTPHRQVVSAA